MEREALEVAAASVASKSTYAGAGSAVLGGLFSIDWATKGGFIIAVVGLAVNWYYKRKADKRREEEHELRKTGRWPSDPSPDTERGGLQ